MSLDAGSCSIAGDGTVTGSGLAAALGNALVAMWNETVLLPTPPYTGALAPAPLAKAHDALASQANHLASAIIGYLVANAEVTVTIAPADSGLQRTPNPNNPNTNTQGPATTKTLFGTLT